MQKRTPGKPRARLESDAIKATARQMLQGQRGFEHCQAQTLDRLVAAGQLRALPKGEVLARRGEPFDLFGILVLGSLESRVLLKGGQRRLLHYLQPGEVFGMTTCCDGGPHVVDLIARGVDTRVVLIPGAVIRALCNEDPALPMAFVHQLAFRGRELYERLITAASVGLSARLARLIIGYARHHGIDKPFGRQIAFKASQADFADMLGTSRQNVNSELLNFREKGFIATRYSTITVLDFEGLCRFAGLELEARTATQASWPPQAS